MSSENASTAGARRRAIERSFWHAAFWPSSLAAILSTIGCVVLAAEPLDSQSQLPEAAIVAIAATAISSLSGWRLMRLEGRFFFFKLVLVYFSGSLSLFACEMLARRRTPAWPAIGLHGTYPRAALRNWGRIVKTAGGTSYNSWGQRDRERSRKPTLGIERVLFIGDSFLEESSTEPLSIVMERLLPGFEVLNLGVSATAPDEYYYRLKNIGLPLAPAQVFFFVFEGNDYIRQPTLASWGGIAAVYPRDSLWSLSGLLAINHLLTNRRRPVIYAWRHGQLHASEQALARRFEGASDERILRLLLELADAGDRPALERLFHGRDLRPLFEALRRPAQGLWRSHYLRLALHEAVEQPRRESDAAYSLEWILRARDLCGRRGVRFTLVVIPEGNQVDPAMRAVWAPLADMRRALAYQREASLRLLRRAQAKGVVCIDLFTILDGVPGTYLNLDGHWSDRGVEQIARGLAGTIRSGRRVHGS